MNEAELMDLVDAWIAGVLYGKDQDGRSTKAYEENWWALEQVMNWKHDNQPELLWRFILRVHERDANDRVAGHLASGPVEDLMSEFGETYIERVEHLAREDSRFKRMLCSVWQDRMSEGLWSRFQQAREGAC